MEFYEVIEKRRTIRDFESEDIPKEVIERVISAAMKAPTNDHMRDWHFIIVKDRETAPVLLYWSMKRRRLTRIGTFF